MKTKQEALVLARRVRTKLEADGALAACALLEPILRSRTRFPLLELVGREAVRGMDLSLAGAFLDQVASLRREGGWVIVGAALQKWLDTSLIWALGRARRYVGEGAIWYAADILGERVPGDGLVRRFNETVGLLTLWTADRSPWVRRACGVAVHHWAKRAHGHPELEAQACRLLCLLDPLFEETDRAALKGVGWGLKTLGRFYPGTLVTWLEEQIETKRRHPRRLLLRKALTYVPPEDRQRFESFR